MDDKYCRRRLHNALKKNDLLGVKHFVETIGVNINGLELGRYKCTPLYLAMVERNIDIVRYLLEKGADVDCQHDRLPLLMSVDSNDVEMAQVLLDHGATVDLETYTRDTPLKHAITLEYVNLVELLISRGADVNTKDNMGLTALHLAVKNNDLRLVEFFLSKGANINSSNADGVTALEFTCISDDAKKGYNFEMIKILIEKGANANIADHVGYTPFMVMLYNEWSIRDKCEETNWEKNTNGIEVSKFLLRCTDVRKLGLPDQGILDRIEKYECLWKMLVEHMAIRLQTQRNQVLDSTIHNAIVKKDIYRKYLSECVAELFRAKCTKISDTSVSFFNLLVDNEARMENHAQNVELVVYLATTDSLEHFPIYKTEICNNLMNALNF